MGSSSHIQSEDELLDQTDTTDSMVSTTTYSTLSSSFSLPPSRPDLLVPGRVRGVWRIPKMIPSLGKSYGCFMIRGEGEGLICNYWHEIWGEQSC